ncbi:MAG: phospholipid carrier-dependent glycosyltransferase [Caldiserica bacterium]|nr:phospholipid carrier-dependent glycosyltransferase [Caldisericota bacterium]
MRYLSRFFVKCEDFTPVIIGILSFLILSATLSGIGLTWDEPFYLFYPLSYGEWFKAPHLSTISRYFPNEAHPPLGKYITGSGLLLFASFLSPLTAIRLPVVIIASLLVVFLYLITRKFYGREAGYFSAFALLLTPRVFGHMHLATLDISLTFFFFISVWAFYRGLSSIRWSVIFGIFAGLAISVKAAGFFLFPALIIWALVFRKKEAWRNFAFSLVLTPLLFFLLWPRMWVNTSLHMKQFVLNQIIRLHIPVYYFGKAYTEGMRVPWHYPLLMTVFTVPFFLLILSLLGIILLFKKDKNKQDEALFVFPPLFFFFMVSLPQAEKYDGIRLFLPVFPFLMFFAGKGFLFLKEKYLKSRYLLLYLLLLPSLVSLFLIHPFYLSYYNALIGGLKGAEKRGMELTYWGDAINRKVFAWINANASWGSIISFYPAGYRQVKLYSLLGYLRKDLQGQDTINQKAEYVVLQMRKGMFNQKCRELLKYGKEVFSLEKDGVSLVKIYKGGKLAGKSGSNSHLQ